MMSQSVISRYRIKFRFIVNRENCYLSNMGLVVLFISADLYLGLGRGRDIWGMRLTFCNRYPLDGRICDSCLCGMESEGAAFYINTGMIHYMELIFTSGRFKE